MGKNAGNGRFVGLHRIRILGSHPQCRVHHPLWFDTLSTGHCCSHGSRSGQRFGSSFSWERRYSPNWVSLLFVTLFSCCRQPNHWASNSLKLEYFQQAFRMTRYYLGDSYIIQTYSQVHGSIPPNGIWTHCSPVFQLDQG